MDTIKIIKNRIHENNRKDRFPEIPDFWNKYAKG
jgi:hypothetical protein